MKSFKVVSVLAIGMSFNICFAQDSTRKQHTPSLEEQISKSNAVIEGEVISTDCIETKTNIYTSATVRISKVFKGNISDTIIEVVYVGGFCDGNYQLLSHGMSLTKGNDGVFLLANNTGVQISKSLQSYQPSSYIAYHHGAEMMGHHIATCRGVTYDDLETDLFQKIESTTGSKRKILGLNKFERGALK